MNKKIIIIIAAVLVVGGGAAAFFLLGGEKGDPELFQHKYLPGEYMVTNVKGSKHLLKTSVALVIETPDKDALSANDQLALDNMQIEMRDIINSIQREKTLEDLQSDNIKETLRDEIVAELKAKLELENLVTVYFNDFVMQ